ncbi:(2Fe-2S)-binding protein, partial [Klebsiella pneumoniae]
MKTTTPTPPPPWTIDPEGRGGLAPRGHPVAPPGAIAGAPVKSTHRD